MKRKVILGCIVLLICGFAYSQIGIRINESDNLEGYTLYHPNAYTSTFLIDNEGNLLHEWEGEHQPGRSVYLLENGNLLRTGQLENIAFADGGGRGGRIEILNWENEILWAYEISNDIEAHHHDVAIMPNGNILAIIWVEMSSENAISNGRDPLLLDDGEVWLEKIIEIKPVGTSEIEIIWEWRLEDHLIQDHDDTKLNYGDVSTAPEKVDFNYVKSGAADWIHMNSIDYNAELDQIMLSSPFLNEVWIIDHSTTTAEAATSIGGNSNKGGDLLYRWGNPIAYGNGSIEDQKFFGQHNAQWLLEDTQWKMLLFNNGNGRSEQYSSIEMVDLPYNALTNNYTLQENRFLPENASFTYTAPVPTDFYSRIISGVQVLPNNNILICEGLTGRFFELNETEEIVWEYVNPVTNDFLCVDDFTAGGSVFRATKYETSYTGFNGITFDPEIKLEDIGCIEDPEEPPILGINKNDPVIIVTRSNHKIIFNTSDRIEELTIHSIDGKELHRAIMYDSQASINRGYLTNSIYVVRAVLSNGKIAIQKFYNNN